MDLQAGVSATQACDANLKTRLFRNMARLCVMETGKRIDTTGAPDGEGVIFF
jgi:hypothetical protein